jgi:mono/diheme cytochrome c family protein
LVAEVLSAQLADGGWAPLPRLGSDAWATGLTLFVLHEVGGVAAGDPRYRRGADFLLRTQFPDGSWRVPTRTWPLQPHFDGGFPHGKDQWSSAGGTAWATIALLNEFAPVVRRVDLPDARALMARHPQTTPGAPAAAGAATPAAGGIGADDTAGFERDIRPVLERSCVGCHGGEKPRGGYGLATRDAALKGGQSGEPAIVPGHGDRGTLLRFVEDRVEDLEMPPLAKRGKYPALTREETARLRAWIDRGAPWPAGATLRAPGN